MDQTEKVIECALDLMRRLPPQSLEKNLSDLIDLAPQVSEVLLASVDQPLKTCLDESAAKEYLLCDYNRDGDSYRSPWTNSYNPPLDDGAIPTKTLRRLEIDLNFAFEQYRDLYFEGGISSAYLWELDHCQHFAAAIVIKKEGDGSKKIDGCWNSFHVLEILEKPNGRSAHYKLTSTVMLWLQTDRVDSGTMNLSGSLTRQAEDDGLLNEETTHTMTIGKMVEDLECKMRSTLNDIYFGKTRNIVNNLHSIQSLKAKSFRASFHEDLASTLAQRTQSQSEPLKSTDFYYAY